MSMGRQETVERLSEMLTEEREVVFAYLYGSFMESGARDIDIAIYVDEGLVDDALRYQLRLSTKIEMAVRFPVDVLILNHAPMKLQYQAIKGRLLICKDNEMRLGFVEQLLIDYLDYRPLEEQMIEDILSL
ncbi:MAG: nucleotidyltransferase domain-containing protein [Candidatus Thorarchaeota archaeon]|nr:MAG: nucleotidyltransferase domain-containing protein [Candidatus Thorarchaeota archaeon]